MSPMSEMRVDNQSQSRIWTRAIWRDRMPSTESSKWNLASRLAHSSDNNKEKIACVAQQQLVKWSLLKDTTVENWVPRELRSQWGDVSREIMWYFFS